MHIWLLSSSLAMFLTAMTLATAFILNSRSYNDQEKLSPFECGFDPKSNARVPFSMRFFLLAIIFLVFDIEIVLLIPIPLLMHTNNKLMLLAVIMFIALLVIGLFHEWIEGSLNWSS